MSRYFFGVQNGESFPDDDGLELSDVRAAREMAIRMAGELLSDHGGRFWGGHDWKLEVTNEHGSLLFVLTFAAYDAPAIDHI